MYSTIFNIQRVLNYKTPQTYTTSTIHAKYFILFSLTEKTRKTVIRDHDILVDPIFFFCQFIEQIEIGAKITNLKYMYELIFIWIIKWLISVPGSTTWTKKVLIALKTERQKLLSFSREHMLKMFSLIAGCCLIFS